MSSLNRSIRTVLSDSVEKYSSSSTCRIIGLSLECYQSLQLFRTSVPSSSITRYTSNQSSISNFSLAGREIYFSLLSKTWEECWEQFSGVNWRNSTRPTLDFTKHYVPSGLVGLKLKPFMIKSSSVAAMIPFLNSRNLSMTLNGLFSSFLLTSSTVTRSSEQTESMVSPRDKIGLISIKNYKFY